MAAMTVVVVVVVVVAVVVVVVVVVTSTLCRRYLVMEVWGRLVVTLTQQRR
jgi:hypothetical protein